MTALVAAAARRAAGRVVAKEMVVVHTRVEVGLGDGGLHADRGGGRAAGLVVGRWRRFGSS